MLWKFLVDSAEGQNPGHLPSKNQESILPVSVWKMTKETRDKKDALSLEFTATGAG